jgi:hypothetical protein
MSAKGSITGSIVNQIQRLILLPGWKINQSIELLLFIYWDSTYKDLFFKGGTLRTLKICPKWLLKL